MTIPEILGEFLPLEVIDDLVSRWKKIVVPFMVQHPHSEHRALGLGSGFTVQRHGFVFMVTALHVLNDMIEGGPVFAKFGDRAICLNGVVFTTSKQDDLAIALIDSELAKENKLEILHAQPLDAPVPIGARCSAYVLLGYPGARNKLNLRAPRRSTHFMSYTLWQRIEHTKALTHIRNPVAFHFDKKHAIDTSRRRINVGAFNGISGGPVLQVCRHIDETGNIRLSTDLAGVFVGWDKLNKEILCIRPEAVIALIDRLFERAKREQAIRLSPVGKHT